MDFDILQGSPRTNPQWIIGNNQRYLQLQFSKENDQKERQISSFAKEELNLFSLICAYLTLARSFEEICVETSNKHMPLHLVNQHLVKWIQSIP